MVCAQLRKQDLRANKAQILHRETIQAELFLSTSFSVTLYLLKPNRFLFSFLCQFHFCRRTEAVAVEKVVVMCVM